jgi:hypothetical protein
VPATPSCLAAPTPTSAAADGKPPLGQVSVLAMGVRVTGCGASDVAPTIELNAGTLEKLVGRKGAKIKAYGAPRGLRLELQAAGGAWPAPEECMYTLPVRLDAGEARTYTRGSAPRGSQCLCKLGFRCAAPVALKVRLRAHAINATKAYAAGPWSPDATFTPSCDPAAAACACQQQGP